MLPLQRAQYDPGARAPSPPRRRASARRGEAGPGREASLALKLLEAHTAAELREEARSLLGSMGHAAWVEDGGRFGARVRAVLGAGRTGEALDRLHEEIGSRGPLLVLVEPLDGVLPRPHATPASEARAEARTAAAVSREEVYASIADTARPDRVYALFTVLATVVGAVGLARDNTAAVIGAMVVAPLLGPNMALALGLVLGDFLLVRRALRTNALGLALAFGTAVLLGLALRPDPATPELASRTSVGLADLAVALAAGCAGALAYTTGTATFLTGVMVAVALLPPAVAAGMLLATGSALGAASALLLALGNVTALTLAAIVTFWWQGMRPRTWWEADRARRSARTGALVFVGLLLLLAGLIALAGSYPGAGF